MGVERMTRDEFFAMAMAIANAATAVNCRASVDSLWQRIDAIQSAPYVPDWNKKPEGCIAFVGFFTDDSEEEWRRTVGKYEDWLDIHAGFYIPAPPPEPTPDELWAKLTDEQKRTALNAVKE